MRFPFILRSDHDEQVRLLNVIICTLEDSIRTRDWEIQARNEEIRAMSEMLAAPKAAIPATFESSPSSEQVITGRGAWRAKALLKTRSTIKPTGDSAASLNDKVRREGGKT